MSIVNVRYIETGRTGNVVTSEISDGNMHPNLPAYSPQENFENFCRLSGIIASSCVGLRIDPALNEGALVSTKVAAARPGEVNCASRLPVHSLITMRNVGIFVLSGDCYPVAISASEHHALAHVGWRSVDEDLIGKTINAFRRIGYPPASLDIRVGPGISAQSNIVHITKALQLHGKNRNRWTDFIQPGPTADTVSIDLASAILQQMIDTGVSSSQVDWDDRDTFTDPTLFSRRSYMSGSDKPRGNHVCIVPPTT